MARRKKQPEDQQPENADQNTGSDDTFGLPEIEYEPINREATPEPGAGGPEPEIDEPEYIEEQPVNQTTMEKDEVQNEYTSSYYDEDEGNSPWPKILGIIAILLLVGGAVWFFGFHRPKQEAAAAEKARQEEQARLEASKLEENRLAEQRRIQEEQQRNADSLASVATPAAGAIETLNERTGRYYVVIASAIDGDLIMDYAKKLSQNGVSAKIIPPYGKVKFHRLTVAEGDTFVATQQTADGLKGTYNDGAWVIKY